MAYYEAKNMTQSSNHSISAILKFFLRYFVEIKWKNLFHKNGKAI